MKSVFLLLLASAIFMTDSVGSSTSNVKLTKDFFTLLQLPIIIVSCIIEKKYYIVIYILELAQEFLGLKTANARVNAAILYRILRPLCPIP